MAQRQRKQEEPTLSLQIPKLADSRAPTAVQIPNGFELNFGGNTKIRVTSEITPTSQMIYLNFDLSRLMDPARKR